MNRPSYITSHQRICSKALAWLLIAALSGLGWQHLHAETHAEIYRWVDANGNVQFGDKRYSQQSQTKNSTLLQLVTQKTEWRPFEFEVNHKGVELSAAELKAIYDGTNTVYQFYNQIMHFDMYATVPVKIYILPTRAAYIDFIAQYSNGDATQSSGMYLTKTNSIAVFMRKSRSATFATIRHEVSHAIIDTATPFTPAWLNEGLAEQMETIRIDGDVITVDRHAYNNERVKWYADNLRVNKVLDLKSSEWRHQNNEGKFIYQAFSGELIYFLLSSINGRSFVTQILHEYKRGSRLRSKHLIDQYYFGGVTGMESAWNEWFFSPGAKQIQFAP